MRKMKGSGNYLRNQVRINLAKSIACIFLFFLTFSAAGLQLLLTFELTILVIVGFAGSLVSLIAFYYFLRKYRIYGGGWEGEKQVIKLLGNKLSDDYILLNDLYLRGGAGDIDQVVLGPNGIFVLETKNWNGRITCNGDLWQREGRHNFRGNPSLQVKRNSSTIRHIIDSSQNYGSLGISVEGIVVFTNKHATLNLNNQTVSVVTLAQLPSHITACRSSSTFSRQQLEDIGREILNQKR